MNSSFAVVKPATAPYHGRRYSEFRTGDRFVATMLVDDDCLRRAAELIGDFNPLHVDEEFARASRFNSRILHGVITSAMMAAPFGNLVAGTAVAYLEHNTRFLAPVRPGDSLRIEWHVTELIDKPHHGGGVVVARGEALNQHGECVAVADGKMLVAD